MTATDVVTVVAVDPATALAVFTEEIDAWWRRGPRYRFRPATDGVLQFEKPGPDGRLIEVCECDGDAYEVGRVLRWEAPGQFEFMTRAYERHECTEVDVRFEGIAPGTRVTLAHRGWDRLRPDHPTRHGLTGPAFASMIGVWWGDQLVTLGAWIRGCKTAQRR